MSQSAKHRTPRVSRRAVLRLVDANANRALEATRVCEDVVRLHWGDMRGYRRVRTLRHAIGQAVRTFPVPVQDLLRARATRRDPGRQAKASRVASLDHLLLMNFQRAKESLRTLEECSRVVAPARTRRFQALRFRTYEVERDLLLRLATVRRHRS